MITYFTAGVVIVCTVFFTLCRVAPLRRWLGYATIVDVVFTVLMLTMFHATITGLMAATFAGLFMAIMLTVLRKVLGYEKAEFYIDGMRIKVRWIRHKAPGLGLRPPKAIRVLINMWRARHA